MLNKEKGITMIALVITVILICLLSAMVLLTYMLFFTYPIIYYIGILGIVLGLNFAMSFIISATIINDVRKENF